MGRGLLSAVLCLAVGMMTTAVWAADAPGAAAPEEGEAQTQNLTEINKKLTNPVSELWSITFQQNNFRIDTGEATYWNSNLNFQPVMPVAPVIPKLVKGTLIGE